MEGYGRGKKQGNHQVSGPSETVTPFLPAVLARNSATPPPVAAQRTLPRLGNVHIGRHINSPPTGRKVFCLGPYRGAEEGNNNNNQQNSLKFVLVLD